MISFHISQRLKLDKAIKKSFVMQAVHPAWPDSWQFAWAGNSNELSAPLSSALPDTSHHLTPEIYTQMGKVESWGQGSCHEAF